MTHALEIRGLKKTYPGGTQAVKGIDLTVKHGDFYALLGPNGAGKSTTIGIVASLVNKTEGEVRVYGLDLDTQKNELKKQLGLVPQEFNFNQFETVMQIVINQAGFYGVPRDLAKERAEHYLKQLSLWDKRDDRARTLSGGMKRRLLIARALLHEPKLLILDEPTAGVDIELRRSMWEFLKEINQQGVTIILTTHYLEEAEMLCRNIGIINHGEIIQDTNMKDLLSQLDMETFVFDLAGENLKLETAITLKGIEARRIDTHTLEVDLHKTQDLNQVFAQLTEQGIQVTSMRNKANRLEELFVHIVEQGRQPASQAAEASVQEKNGVRSNE